MLDRDKVVISNYIFYHTEKSRTAFVAIKWDGHSPFILPPSVDILYLDDGKVSKYVSMTEIFARAEGLFKPIDGYSGPQSIKRIDAKNTKKLYKIITKDNLSRLNTMLHLLSMDKILDI